ncbi:MAG: NAD-dependent epimerase/dehydratase family protein [Spirochaetales bacterium]|nr:NAD-dependent epimerase/dehydratase family protein [Spirochaetales bacterium]
MKTTISGSNGFIGSRLIDLLFLKGLQVQCVKLRYSLEDNIDIPIGDTFVHLAAIAHSDNSEKEQIFAVNRDLAVSAARKARELGYSHFIFLSSVLVWGSENEFVSFSVSPNPDTNYGRAKLEAEQIINSFNSSKFTVSIIRPPLVHGPYVKGNLRILIRAIQKWPLCPLGSFKNRRSMLNLDNLCEFIYFLIKNRLGGTFCIQDQQSISSMQLINYIAEELPSHGLITPMPRLVQLLIKKFAPGIYRRLFNSFLIEDDSALAAGFSPPFSTKDGIKKMVQAYLQ